MIPDWPVALLEKFTLPLGTSMTRQDHSKARTNDPHNYFLHPAPINIIYNSWRRASSQEVKISKIRLALIRSPDSRISTE